MAGNESNERATLSLASLDSGSRAPRSDQLRAQVAHLPLQKTSPAVPKGPASSNNGPRLRGVHHERADRISIEEPIAERLQPLQITGAKRASKFDNLEAGRLLGSRYRPAMSIAAKREDSFRFPTIHAELVRLIPFRIHDAEERNGHSVAPDEHDVTRIREWRGFIDEALDVTEPLHDSCSE